jgi:hypothetical protein
MTVSSAAFAQTKPAPIVPSDRIATATSVDSTAAKPAAGEPATATAVSAEQTLTSNLQQSGLTDVKVMPNFVIVQAKDKSGNPLTMFVSSDSVAVLTAGITNVQTMPTDAGGKFATIAVGDDLSSKVVGLDVHNAANQDIGTIKDVAFDASGVKAYIVGVGGFLGMGDHYVAVSPSAITLSYDVTKKTWHALMDTTASDLKAAPEYKYPSTS